MVLSSRREPMRHFGPALEFKKLWTHKRTGAHTHTVHTTTGPGEQENGVQSPSPTTESCSPCEYLFGVLPGANVQRLPYVSQEARTFCIPSCPAFAFLPSKRLDPFRGGTIEGCATNAQLAATHSCRRTCLILENGGAAVDDRRVPSQCDLCNGVREKRW